MAFRKLGAAQMRSVLQIARSRAPAAGYAGSCRTSSSSGYKKPAGTAIAATTIRANRAYRNTAALSLGRRFSAGSANADVNVNSRVPDVTTKFGDPSFWEGEYSSQYASNEELEPFEWFLPYEGGLQQHLLPFLESMPNCNRLLHVGCGTSEVGPRIAVEPNLKLHVTDADSSPSAVRLMKRRHSSLDNYTCHETDVLNLPFPEGSYDAVVDKGTLDALLCRSSEDALGMASEVHRVLRKGGVFLQITTEEPEARLEMLTKSSQGDHERWSRSLFKEIGEGANATYFMYVLVK